MINGMQIVVHYSLLHIYFPANALIFFKMLIAVANFDVINSQAILFFFHFTESNPFNEKFNDLDIFWKNEHFCADCIKILYITLRRQEYHQQSWNHIFGAGVFGSFHFAATIFVSAK